MTRIGGRNCRPIRLAVMIVNLVACLPSAPASAADPDLTFYQALGHRAVPVFEFRRPLISVPVRGGGVRPEVGGESGDRDNGEVRQPPKADADGPGRAEPSPASSRENGQARAGKASGETRAPGPAQPAAETPQGAVDAAQGGGATKVADTPADAAKAPPAASADAAAKDAEKAAPPAEKKAGGGEPSKEAVGTDAKPQAQADKDVEKPAAVQVPSAQGQGTAADAQAAKAEPVAEKTVAGASGQAAGVSGAAASSPPPSKDQATDSSAPAAAPSDAQADHAATLPQAPPATAQSPSNAGVPIVVQSQQPVETAVIPNDGVKAIPYLVAGLAVAMILVVGTVRVLRWRAKRASIPVKGRALRELPIYRPRHRSTIVQMARRTRRPQSLAIAHTA